MSEIALLIIQGITLLFAGLTLANILRNRRRRD